LLVEAYQNREVLEEKIAEGRRNRKEAGNKYGMPRSNLPTYARCLTVLKGFDVMETMPVSFMQADIWTSTHTSLSFCVVFRPQGLPASVRSSLSDPVSGVAIG
jgi:Mitotic checkpoint regulator, MAD2B-interacting